MNVPVEGAVERGLDSAADVLEWRSLVGEWSLINPLSLLRRSLKRTSLLVVAGTFRQAIGSKLDNQFHFCLIHMCLVFWISGSLHPGGYVAEICPSDPMFTLVFLAPSALLR